MDRKRCYRSWVVGVIAGGPRPLRAGQKEVRLRAMRRHFPISREGIMGMAEEGSHTGERGIITTAGLSMPAAVLPPAAFR